MWATVDQDGKVGCGNTSKYPIPPFSTIPTALREVGEELPIDMVMSLFQVQFAHSTLDIQEISNPLVEIMFSKSASTVFIFLTRTG